MPIGSYQWLLIFYRRGSFSETRVCMQTWTSVTSHRTPLQSPDAFSRTYIVCTYIQCGCSLPNKKLCVRLRGNRIWFYLFLLYSVLFVTFFAFAMGIVFLLCCCLCCLMILSVTYHIFEMFSMCSFFYSWREELTYYFRNFKVIL